MKKLLLAGLVMIGAAAPALADTAATTSAATKGATAIQESQVQAGKRVDRMQHWQKLSAEQQQQVISRAKAEWNKMSPQQQERIKLRMQPTADLSGPGGPGPAMKQPHYKTPKMKAFKQLPHDQKVAIIEQQDTAATAMTKGKKTS